MKTLYIPTTTLNFNNILSSESISPRAFYAKRGFGYTRWYSVPENSLENAIILYDSKRSFSRPESDYEDHPLLIEMILNDCDLGKLENISPGIYLSYETLYLDPWNTTFMFFTERDKTITISMSDSSIETKCVNLYRSKFLVVNDLQTEYCGYPTNDMVKFSLNEINKDIKINNLKGLLYGFYIGGLLSSTLTSVRKLNVLREIRDVFAAVTSSLDRRATPVQYNRLKMLFSLLIKGSTFYQRILSVVGDESMTNQILEIVSVEYGNCKSTQSPDYFLDLIQRYDTKKDANNIAAKWIEQQITKQEMDIVKERKLFDLDKPKIIVSEGELTAINVGNVSDFERHLLTQVINKIFVTSQYNGKISTFKEVLSDDITKLAKSITEGEWKGSKQEIIFNSLRRHVRGAEFAHNWGNDVYSSIAAVLTNGADRQKLLQFMQSKEMNEFSIAFAIFGALNGFANLPRDFTDVLLNMENRKYIADVYKEFCGELFNKRIFAVFKKNDNQLKEKEGNTMIEDHKAAENENNSVIQFEQFKEKFSSSRIRDSFLKDIYGIFLKYNCVASVQFYKEIKKHKGIGPAAIEKIQNVLGVKYGQTNNELSLPFNEVIQDPDGDDIVNYKCFCNLSKEIMDRIRDNWRFTKGKDPRNYVNYFINLCKKEGKGQGRHRELQGVFTEDLANAFLKEYNSQKR